jgi:putative chitinase
MSWRDTQQKLQGFGYSVAVDGIPGPQTYAALFAYMGAKDAAAMLGQGAAVHFPAYRIDGDLRVAHWLAQFGHESAGFTKFEESLGYSAQRLCAVWPSRFPNLLVAKPYANNPEALANKVYGGRLGNDQPGDGWRFRGRGPQLTGRENYSACAKRTGLDIESHPDLAAKPENFVHIACDFWAQACCNALADKDDLRAITLKINGGYIGIAERGKVLARAKAVLL